MKTWTESQFDKAIAATMLNPAKPPAKAARLVLVEGLSRHEAARQVGTDVRAVSRAVSRLQPRQRCPTCGQQIIT
jgi:DNA-directed RNA polymerase specialized sigma24 family protein